MQRYLYDRCTINHNEVHFLHADHFDEAMARIDEIKAKAIESNAQLKDSWLKNRSGGTRWLITLSHRCSQIRIS